MSKCVHLRRIPNVPYEWEMYHATLLYIKSKQSTSKKVRNGILTIVQSIFLSCRSSQYLCHPVPSIRPYAKIRITWLWNAMHFERGISLLVVEFANFFIPYFFNFSVVIKKLFDVKGGCLMHQGKWQDFLFILFKNMVGKWH